MSGPAKVYDEYDRVDRRQGYVPLTEEEVKLDSTPQLGLAASHNGQSPAKRRSLIKIDD